VIYVIGSGPAGVAAAETLLQEGREVTMLDAGRTLEPSIQERVAEVSRTPSHLWTDEMLMPLKGDVDSSAKGVVLKKIFGSAFPYEKPSYAPAWPKGIDLKTSLAMGGFSNVWGAVVLPWLEKDCVNWPFQPDDLKPYLARALQLMPLSHPQQYGLSSLFPMPHKPPVALNSCRQARALLVEWARNEQVLKESGFSVGTSRLAVRAEESHEGPGCVYCGMCLYGCPYGLIYNAAATVLRLKKNSRFTYRPGLFADRLEETGHNVIIHASQLSGLGEMVFPAERVFVAGGVLSSTRLVLESLSHFDQPVTVLDNQYFLLPFLTRKGVVDVESEKMHTLCQLLMSVMDPTVSPFTVNLQLYAYNDLYRHALLRLFGPAASLAQPFMGAILGRLMLVQGYLHSHDSNRIRLTLRKTAAGARFDVETDFSDRPRKVLKQLVRALWKRRAALGGWPVGPFLQRGQFSTGNHSGGTLPMKVHPKGAESDTLGRPGGFQRIHVVDSSVLPSLPATSITLGVMANASRIATLSTQL